MVELSRPLRRYETVDPDNPSPEQLQEQIEIRTGICRLHRGRLYEESTGFYVSSISRYLQGYFVRLRKLSSVLILFWDSDSDSSTHSL